MSGTKDEPKPVALDVASDMAKDPEAQNASAEVEKPEVEKPNPEVEKPRKLPRLTFMYWLAKILATTLGEVFADMFSQTYDFGYQVTSEVFFGIFVVGLIMQLITKRYVPPIYWLVIISSRLAGTCLSDMMDRNVFAQEKAGYAVGYAKGMSLLLGILLALFITWRCSGHSLSVTGPMTRIAEFFYWACIIVSNTLGTAVGDFTSDNLELGFAGGACLYGGLMLLTAILAVCTPISRVGLFWVWFVLTRPFGATFGDLLTKKKVAGGLQVGTEVTSMIFGLPLIAVVIFIVYAEWCWIPLPFEPPAWVKRLQKFGDKPLFTFNRKPAVDVNL
mmetsp:Transcript_7708/g.21536  ORF Transcript_7708/g.21536 Transcript_7708/m.21536 type:complete len:332 (+) Transcript_7708:53-1048(+)